MFVDLLLESKNPVENLTEDTKTNVLVGLTLSALIGYLVWYFKHDKKIFFMYAAIPDKDIKKVRKFLSKFSSNKVSLQAISNYFKKQGYFTTEETFRVLKPFGFLKNFRDLMSTIYAYFKDHPGDGLFTSDEVKRLYKVLLLPQVRKLFCKTVQYTRVEADYRYRNERGYGGGSSFSTSTNETIEKCEYVYNVLLEIAKEAIAHRSGLFIGALPY